MKARSANHACTIAFAALTIVGCCLGSIRWSEKQRVTRRRQLEDAVQTWEAEGGAVPASEADEDEVRMTVT